MSWGALVFLAILAAVGIACYVRRAGNKAGFHPVPCDTCDGDRAMTSPYSDRDGTVVGYPFSTQSRVALERGADAPGLAERPNPVTGLRKGAFVRADSSLYRRGQELAGLDAFELGPDRPGAMALAPPPCHASCSRGLTDIDSDFLTDGPFGAATLKETLTSRRGANPNTLTGSRVGLGSTRLDPRFEPGPQCRVAGGEASPSPGSHAGGITLGALNSCQFRPGASWDATYNFGFATDACDGGPPEAIETERSRW
jgi:hypothetical protein